MRTKVEQVSCDFCGYGGVWSRAEDFTRTGTVDLCRWCAGAPTGQGVMSSGRHEVTITADSWECTCGDRYARPFLVPPRVLDALRPSSVRARADTSTASDPTRTKAREALTQGYDKGGDVSDPVAEEGVPLLHADGVTDDTAAIQYRLDHGLPFPEGRPMLVLAERLIFEPGRERASDLAKFIAWASHRLA